MIKLLTNQLKSSCGGMLNNRYEGKVKKINEDAIIRSANKNTLFQKCLGK